MTDAIGSDRESLLRATSILDLLAAGWQPGSAELRHARRLENWTVMPGPAASPYQLVGTIYTQAPFVLTESVLAIDPQVGWARMRDEWLFLGTRLTDAPPVDPADVQRVGAAWLIRQLIGLSVH